MSIDVETSVVLSQGPQEGELDRRDPARVLSVAVVLPVPVPRSQMNAPLAQRFVLAALARKALKADESFRDARNLLGQVLILEKKYDEAIATLEPLTKDPAYTANYLAWGNLGWAQVLSGQIDAGIASLRNAITQPR